jgi:plasmid stability protein
MPVNLSIKNAPEKVVRKLKKRAERNHRSLQGELMAIITEAAERPQPLTLKELVERPPERPVHRHGSRRHRPMDRDSR